MPPSKLGRRSGASLVPDAATIQKRLAMLPVSTYEPGETVIAAGEATGKLLLLRRGSVEVVKEGTQKAKERWDDRYAAGKARRSIRGIPHSGCRRDSDKPRDASHLDVRARRDGDCRRRNDRKAAAPQAGFSGGRQGGNAGRQDF